jgi:acetylglutamate kinase
MACRIAAALGSSELIIAGTTAGVLDAAGRTIPTLDASAIDALIASGTANAGMITKLRACREALEDGVAAVQIIDGRAFDGDLAAAPGTTLGNAAMPGSPNTVFQERVS